ncbi:hypothetical protein MNV49_000046 [Pseudohyphozyma bogoriensis]|nr:hypothetical protein MNV49_000046 [Pseudohyphozyma bogoriensis]
MFEFTFLAPLKLNVASFLSTINPTPTLGSETEEATTAEHDDIPTGSKRPRTSSTFSPTSPFDLSGNSELRSSTSEAKRRRVNDAGLFGSEGPQNYVSGDNHNASTASHDATEPRRIRSSPRRPSHHPPSRKSALASSHSSSSLYPKTPHHVHFAPLPPPSLPRPPTSTTTLAKRPLPSELPVEENKGAGDRVENVLFGEVGREVSRAWVAAKDEEKSKKIAELEREVKRLKTESTPPKPKHHRRVSSVDVDHGAFLNELASFKLRKAPAESVRGKAASKPTNELQDVLQKAFQKKFAKSNLHADTPSTSGRQTSQPTPSDWSPPRPPAWKSSTYERPRIDNFKFPAVSAKPAGRVATEEVVSTETVFGEAISTDQATYSSASTSRARASVPPPVPSSFYSQPQPQNQLPPATRPPRTSSLPNHAASSTIEALPPSEPISPQRSSKRLALRPRTSPAPPNISLGASRPITPGRKKAAEKRNSVEQGAMQREAAGVSSKFRTHSRTASEKSVFDDDTDEDTPSTRASTSSSAAYVLPPPPKNLNALRSSDAIRLSEGSSSAR